MKVAKDLAFSFFTSPSPVSGSTCYHPLFPCSCAVYWEVIIFFSENVAVFPLLSFGCSFRLNSRAYVSVSKQANISNFVVVEMSGERLEFMS